MKARINLSSLRYYMKNLKHNKFEKKIFIIIIIIQY
jgi:tRNA G37 N-methylase Trm5